MNVNKTEADIQNLHNTRGLKSNQDYLSWAMEPNCDRKIFSLSVSLGSDTKRQKYASARLYTAFIPLSRTAERVNNILLTALLKMDVLTHFMTG